MSYLVSVEDPYFLTTKCIKWLKYHLAFKPNTENDYNLMLYNWQ